MANRETIKEENDKQNKVWKWKRIKKNRKRKKRKFRKYVQKTLWCKN